MIFVNLPVKDLAASTRFFEAIGCEKNEQFSNESSSSMVWSDAITFQLLTRDRYATFTKKPIGDAHANSAMLIALPQDSRARVDEIATAAGREGGKADIREPQDLGFLYLRTLEDPDGHTFELMWMNPEAAIPSA
ncbi:VOC family protein [Lysobacter tyrosinilyticus]